MIDNLMVYMVNPRENGFHCIPKVSAKTTLPISPTCWWSPTSFPCSSFCLVTNGKERCVRDKNVFMVDWRLIVPYTDVTEIWASPFPKPLWYWHPPLISPWRFGLWIGLGIQGMPVSLGFWEWGCTKRGDTYITETPASSRFLSLHERCLSWQHTAVQFFFL